jgi:hypothetical protein
MATRVFFVVVAAFWVVMNVLLWRAEFGKGRETLSAVPVETVLDRLLNAPDASVLQVRHHGEPIGLLRWIPTVTEVRPDATDPAALAPEGMVTATGYNLDVDLNLHGEVPAERWRVLVHLELNTNHVWQELSVRLFQRPASWEFTAKTGDPNVHVRYEEGHDSWEQTYAVRDLRRLTELLGPYASLLPAPIASDLHGFDPSQLTAGLKWEARNDWLKVGRNRIRVYRVEATLFDRYQVVGQLSRAGEVLKLRLPDSFLLANEALPSMGAE